MSRCRMQDCTSKIFKNGLCRKHYELKQANKCIVDGCDGEYGVRGLCSKHYSRWKKYGDPTIVKQEQLHGVTVEDRIYKNLKSNGACLEWTGYKDKNGYGHMSVNAVPTLVHRAMWEAHNGPIPKGMCVCHRCDNPACVRIDHLFLGTYADNNHDCILKGRDHKRGLVGEEHNLAILTEDQVMEIRASDEPGKVLAERYGVAQTTILDVRKGRSWRHLPTDSVPSKTCQITEADVIAIRASDKDFKALAEEYGLTTRSVYGIFYGETWSHLPGAHKPKDKGYYKGKLTKSDVLDIRASEESSEILAAKYGIHKSSIANVRGRRTWSHI